MTRGQQKIIDRIRQGGFTTAQWREVAGSSKSLNVQIHHLRKQGYKIEVKKAWAKGKVGCAPATYTLNSEPGK